MTLASVTFTVVAILFRVKALFVEKTRLRIITTNSPLVTIFINWIYFIYYFVICLITHQLSGYDRGLTDCPPFQGHSFEVTVAAL